MTTTGKYGKEDNDNSTFSSVDHLAAAGNREANTAGAKKRNTWDRESWSSYAQGNNEFDHQTKAEDAVHSPTNTGNSLSSSRSVSNLLDPVSQRTSLPKMVEKGILRLFSGEFKSQRSAGMHSRSRSLDMLLDDRQYERLNFEEEEEKVRKMEAGCNNKPVLKPEFVDFYSKVLQTFLHPLGKLYSEDPNSLQMGAYLQKVFNVPNEIHVEMMQDELSNNKSPTGLLKVTVVEAKNILSMDANGMSDPYCLLTLCKKEFHQSSSHEKHPHLTHWNSFPDDPTTPSTPAASHSEKFNRRNSDQRRSFKKNSRKKSDDASATFTPLMKARSETLTVSNKHSRRKNSADWSSIASPKVTNHSQSLEAESVFKTSCQRATLHPVWNETFDIAVSSIDDTELTLTMWDMDEETSLWQACKSLESDHKMAGIKNLFRHIKHGINKNTDDFLGQVIISLAEIPAVVRVDEWYTLQIHSKGSGPSNGGKCHLRLQFVREAPDGSEKGNSSRQYYHHLASTVYKYEGQKYINEGKGPWDGKLTSIGRHMLNCFAIQQGISKLSQTLINLSALLEFHHQQNSSAYEYLSLEGVSLRESGKDEVDSAMFLGSLPEPSDNIQKAGEEKGEKDTNRRLGEEKVKEDPDASLMDRALREAMFHIHAEMLAETTFSIYSSASKDVAEIYQEDPNFLSYELQVTESSISVYIDHCMSPVNDCPPLFPPSDVQVLDILKAKCRLNNIFSLLQMKVWKDHNSVPHQRVRKLLEEAIESDTRRWLSNMLEGLPRPEGSLKPADLLNLLEQLGDGLVDMMGLLRPTKEYQNFFMKFTVDYNSVVARQMDHHVSPSLQEVLHQLNQYQVRYQKFAENIAESSKASLKLYMIVKKMCSVLRANNHSCESLQMSNYHTWFQDALVFWLVTFKYETFDRVRRALEMDKDVQLVHSVVKYSNSAVDVQSCFAKVTEEWQRIGFEGVDNRCMAITKITDLICEGAKLYAASIHKKLEQNGFYRSSGQFDIKAKLCITLNNIEHVRVYLDNLPTLLDWEQTVNSLAAHHSNPKAGKLTFSTLQRMTNKASRDIITMSGLLERDIADKMCHEVMKVLGKVVNPRGDATAKEEHLDEFFSYIDHNLETLYKQLMPQIFPRIVSEVWNALLRGIVSLLLIGKPPQYYHELRESLEALESYFQRPGLALDSSTLRGHQYSFLLSQLDLNSLSTHDLMMRYYKDLAMNMATPGEYFGHLGVRMACKEESGGEKTIIIKVCNAVDLPGMDRSGTSDPFVVVEILPETAFEKPLVQQTRYIQHNLNPVFDEMFEIPSVPANFIEAGGVIGLTVMDYDVLWSNDFIGEAFILLQQARPISMNQSVDQCPVIMMPVKRPQNTPGGAFEILKNRCKWDKNARLFYARRQKVIENQKPRTDKRAGEPPMTNSRLMPFLRQMLLRLHSLVTSPPASDEDEG